MDAKQGMTDIGEEVEKLRPPRFLAQQNMRMCFADETDRAIDAAVILGLKQARKYLTEQSGLPIDWVALAKIDALCSRDAQEHCIGYPKCDGDLVATPHSEPCPFANKPEPKMRDRVEAYAEYRLTHQKEAILGVIREKIEAAIALESRAKEKDDYDLFTFQSGRKWGLDELLTTISEMEKG